MAAADGKNGNNENNENDGGVTVKSDKVSAQRLSKVSEYEKSSRV